jgi:hypothetical protein
MFSKIWKFIKGTHDKVMIEQEEIEKDIKKTEARIENRRKEMEEWDSNTRLIGNRGDLTPEQKKKFIYDTHINVVEETIKKTTTQDEYNACVQRLHNEVLTKIRESETVMNPWHHQLELINIEEETGDITVLMYCKKKDVTKE